MIRTAFLAALCCVVFSVNAEARQRHRAVVADPMCNITMPCEGVSNSPRGERIVKAVGFGSAQKVYTPRVSAFRAGETGGTASRRRQTRSIAAQPPSYGPQIAATATIVPNPSGCPSRAFCGCGAAVRVFGSPIRSLWLAANWFKFPRAAPAAGMVAVRSHHVFVLEQHLGGDTWLAYDANSGGHATRIHARSIAGYAIVNPRAG